MTTEVIADSQHLSPELLEFANRMLRPDKHADFINLDVNLKLKQFFVQGEEIKCY